MSKNIAVINSGILFFGGAFKYFLQFGGQAFCLVINSIRRGCKSKVHDGYPQRENCLKPHRFLCSKPFLYESLPSSGLTNPCHEVFSFTCTFDNWLWQENYSQLHSLQERMLCNCIFERLSWKYQLWLHHSSTTNIAEQSWTPLSCIFSENTKHKTKIEQLVISFELNSWKEAKRTVCQARK